MQYNKNTFKQWWQFLQLSEGYNSICELVSSHRKDASEFPLRRLLDELEKNENFKPIERYMKLLAVYEKFGDVHQNDFEEWWKNYNHPNLVKTIKELDEYKEEKHRRINEASEAHYKLRQLYEIIRGEIIYFPDTYTFVQLYVNIKKPIKYIKSDIGKFIKKMKQTAETNRREVINPRAEYLDILRLSLQKNYTMNQIINEIGSKKEKDEKRPEYDNVLRTYRDKKSKALSILHHVEEGRFP